MAQSESVRVDQILQIRHLAQPLRAPHSERRTTGADGCETIYYAYNCPPPVKNRGAPWGAVLASATRAFESNASEPGRRAGQPGLHACEDSDVFLTHVDFLLLRAERRDEENGVYEYIQRSTLWAEVSISQFRISLRVCPNHDPSVCNP